jgi:endoglucanase
MKPYGFLLFIGLLASTVQAGLLVEDGEGNGLMAQPGRSWTTFTDSFSSVSPSNPFTLADEGFDSSHCARLDYEIKAGAPYAFVGFIASFPVTDLSRYAGVRFWAKGQGTWICQIPTSSTAAQYNHYSSPIGLTDTWTLIEVPFSTLTQSWGTPSAWLPQSVLGIQWEATGAPGAKGFICVDDVEFYTQEESRIKLPEADPISPAPKANQEGYLPGQEKYFVITQGPAQEGDPFQILDETGHSALAGKLNDKKSDVASTGETVFQVDFSGLTLPGRYTVKVGDQSSFAFMIGTNPYGSIFKDALHCFSLIRCGTAVDDPATGLKHPACHLKDAALRDNPSRTGDFTGGWHNAGDFGKWTPMASISCAWMMWLYELNPAGPGSDPSLLPEARWGLNWLFKMQRADGSVWHKVDTEPNFCMGTPPDKDPYPRFVAGAGSLDAADFCGVMAQASRVFKASDPAYAARCLEAAEKAWAWLEKNPHVIFHDPYYDDPDPSQEELWALGEMARATRDPKLLGRFEAQATPARFSSVSWMTPQFFGYMAGATDPALDAGERAQLVQTLTGFCDPLADLSDQNGYGVLLKPYEYYWESHENLLDKTGALLFAWRLTAEKRYRDIALRQMDYLLGANSLNLSFVPGHGTQTTAHPHHWAYTDYNILLPGWVAAGPNQFLTGADPQLIQVIRRGTPPAKCFVDTSVGTSWASDEPETAEVAAFVFDCGMLATFK